VGVLTALVGLLASGLVLAGGGLLWADRTLRDADGFFIAALDDLATDTYALTSARIDLGAQTASDGMSSARFATVRLEVESSAVEESVFVGVGPADEVDAYLTGVAHAEVVDVGPGEATTTRTVPGSAPRSAPSQQTFWAASVHGAGAQELTWSVRKGQWRAVIMNVSGSAGVAADVRGGVKSDVVLPLAVGLLAAGLLLGIAVLLVAVRVGGAGTSDAVEVFEPNAVPYPVRLDARLDSRISRWQWLVKWILALPHYVVLAVLLPAAFLATVVAGVAILFTGRYPRRLFDFNVGVMRWTWRVAYYACTGLGTDRYPPFTLSRTDYPADLEVAYPQQLSRRLVLVKWWLLAIPHYLVVGVLGSSAVWSVDVDGARTEILGGGLIGVLSLIAVVSLAVTGHYPRGLFDLVTGLSRWVWRVVAYAALMTDEYPPFRLDTGGADPAAAVPAA
jgi:hypothetical protein